jgi:hypothetical protein
MRLHIPPTCLEVVCSDYPPVTSGFPHLDPLVLAGIPVSSSSAPSG